MLRSRIFISLGVAVVIAMISFGVAIAACNSNTCSWPKSSGITLVADQNWWWTTYDSHMTSDSNVTSQYGAMMNLYTDNRVEDRCRNADGSWQSLHSIAFGNTSAYASYVQLTDTHGPYQNCIYGHQYKFSSLHNYSGYGINESHWLIYGTQ